MRWEKSGVLQHFWSTLTDGAEYNTSGPVLGGQPKKVSESRLKEAGRYMHISAPADVRLVGWLIEYAYIGATPFRRPVCACSATFTNNTKTPMR